MTTRELDDARASLLDALRGRADPAATRARAMVERGRAPRVMVVGRRGSGRSVLLAALGRCVEGALWIDPRRAVSVVEPAGWRGADHAEALKDGVARARAFAPDAVLLAIPATEADAGVDDDLDDAAKVIGAIRPRPALVVALTRSDEAAPPDAATPPWDDDTRASIARAVATAKEHLARKKLRADAVVPVSARVEVSGGETLDLRWNLDALRAALVDALWRRLPGPAARAEELADALRRAGLEVDLSESERRALATPWGWFGVAT
ncbi:MAG: hypothetical protein R3A52_30660 [Polyangiales bacterium]